MAESGRLWKLILLPSGETHCGKTWALWSVEMGLKGHFCSCNYFMHIHLHICVGELQSEHLSKRLAPWHPKIVDYPLSPAIASAEVAPLRAELGRCQVLLLVWPRFCWGRKPSQKQVLGSGTGLCWTSFPTRLNLQSAKNCVVLLKNKSFLSFYISSSQNTPFPPSSNNKSTTKKDKSCLL